jgi:hypothetical protein
VSQDPYRAPVDLPSLGRSRLRGFLGLILLCTTMSLGMWLMFGLGVAYQKTCESALPIVPRTPIVCQSSPPTPDPLPLGVRTMVDVKAGQMLCLDGYLYRWVWPTDAGTCPLPAERP